MDIEKMFLNIPVLNSEELEQQERKHKTAKNLNILRNAIARGDKVSDTLKRIDKNFPLGDNISFMVKNGRFVKKPMQLDLFEGVE